MFVPSEEQQQVIDAVLTPANVVVIAKAGSGKSSVALDCAHKFFLKFSLPTLIITYNARLKEELRSKVSAANWNDHIEAHSYHALAHKYFCPKGNGDDSMIHQALQSAPLSGLGLKFGLLIIDEAQDMSPLYSDFIKHVLCHCAFKPFMLIIGDPFQRIFGFNGATDLYLSNPSSHFAAYLASPLFTRLHLSVCWRITHEMAAFVNTHLDPRLLRFAYPEWYAQHREWIETWWDRGIRASPLRPAEPGSVVLVTGKQFDSVIEMLPVEPPPMLASYSLKYAQRTLKKHPHLEASTIHKLKGLERDCVVLMSMDSYIEQYYQSPIEHFNIWYVAATRARKKLVVNTTKFDYATVRCKEVVQHQHKKLIDVKDLFAYVPFDIVLTDRAVQATIVATLDPLPALTQRMEGVVPGSVIDMHPLINRAAIYKLSSMIHGSLPLVDIEEKFADIDSDICDYVYACRDAEPQDTNWIRYAAASLAVDTGLYHQFNNLPTIGLTQTIDLGPIVQRTYDLIGHVLQLQLGRSPTFQEMQSSVKFGVPVANDTLKGRVDAMVGTSAVCIDCAPKCKAEVALELVTCASMIGTANTLLVLPTMGQIVRVACPNVAAMVRNALHRKLGQARGHS